MKKSKARHTRAPRSSSAHLAQHPHPPLDNVFSSPQPTEKPAPRGAWTHPVFPAPRACRIACASDSPSLPPTVQDRLFVSPTTTQKEPVANPRQILPRVERPTFRPLTHLHAAGLYTFATLRQWLPISDQPRSHSVPRSPARAAHRLCSTALPPWAFSLRSFVAPLRPVTPKTSTTGPPEKAPRPAPRCPQNKQSPRPVTR